MCSRLTKLCCCLDDTRPTISAGAFIVQKTPYWGTCEETTMTLFHDTELLILEIQNRPVLWNCHLEDYKNKKKKSDAWIEVCTAMNPDFESLENANKKQIRK